MSMENLKQIVDVLEKIVNIIYIILGFFLSGTVLGILYRKVKIARYKYKNPDKYNRLYKYELIVGFVTQTVILIIVFMQEMNWERYTIIDLIFIIPYLIGVYFWARKEDKSNKSLIQKNMICAGLVYIMFFIMMLVDYYEVTFSNVIYGICYVSLLLVLWKQLKINIQKTPRVRYEVYTTYAKEIPYKLDKEPEEVGDSLYIEVQGEKNSLKRIRIPKDKINRIEYIPIEEKM